MIQTNLVPDIKQEYLKARRIRGMVVSITLMVSLSAIAVVVVLGVIRGAQIGFDAVADADIKKEFATLKDTPDLTEMLTLQNQLSAIDTIQEKKQLSSKLFDVIVAVNPTPPNDVKISNVALDPVLKTITINGSAAGSYQALDVFKKTINSTKLTYRTDSDAMEVPLAKSISIGDTSYGADSQNSQVLRFTLTFTYTDELFSSTIKDARIITPSNQTDMTDSRARVPESIFSSAARDIQEGN